MDIRARVAATGRWIVARSKTFDLFGEYLSAVYKRWNDYLWNALLVAPVLLWWMLGNPPMWVVVAAFVWALLVAGYFAWREEHLKNVGTTFRCWIYGEVMLGNTVLVGIRITNTGPLPQSMAGKLVTKARTARGTLTRKAL